MYSKDIRRRPKTFAERIAEGHSATEAYLLAGYKPAKRETAHRAASRLYQTPAVRTYVQELRRTGDELAREQTSLTIAQKLAFLTRLVLTSSASLREDDPLIQSHRILKDGSTSIRIPCKLKALKMHSELAGHFAPEPTPPPKTSDPIQDLLDQIRSAQTAPLALQSRESGTKRETRHLIGDASAHLGSAGTQGLGAKPEPSKSHSQATHHPRPAQQTAKTSNPSHPPLALQTRECGTKRETRHLSGDASAHLCSTGAQGLGATPEPSKTHSHSTQNSTPQQTTTNPPNRNESPPQTPLALQSRDCGTKRETRHLTDDASAHLSSTGTQGIGANPEPSKTHSQSTQTPPPQQTTTNSPNRNEPPPQTSSTQTPLTPTAVRKLVLAEIRLSSPYLSNTPLHKTQCNRPAPSGHEDD